MIDITLKTIFETYESMKYLDLNMDVKRWLHFETHGGISVNGGYIWFENKNDALFFRLTWE